MHIIRAERQVPHGAVRVYVMGERGERREPPTQAELGEMTAIVRDAVRSGAIGVSSSQHLGHRRHQDFQLRGLLLRVLGLRPRSGQNRTGQQDDQQRMVFSHGFSPGSRTRAGGVLILTIITRPLDANHGFIPIPVAVARGYNRQR